MIFIKYRKINKLGIELSAFGLGCMRFPMIKDENGNEIVDEKISTDIIRTCIDGGVNYIDTAYIYSGGLNEKYVGLALKDGYREKVYLATKLCTWQCEKSEDMKAQFEEQCRRLGTDYIDFYLVHALSAERWKKMCNFGVVQFLDELKKSGKIKYACFSFHDKYEAFEEIINAYDWDMCQIQFNYMDIENQAGLKGLKLAGEKNVPVVIMEGLLGGKLANVPEEVRALFEKQNPDYSPVEWAFRWLCNFPEVATVLSGVTSVEMAKDNLRIFDKADIGCMSKSELETVEKARELYKKRIKADCTGCEYCMPCPKGVAIPKIFSAWNKAFMYESNDGYYSHLKQKGQDASACVECGKCMKVCPQNLKITELLKEADKYLA